MKSFLGALGFLTILPVPGHIRLDTKILQYAWMWFPLVGLLVDSIAGAVYALGVFAGFPTLLAATLAVGTLIITTRAFHYDGFSDTVDAAFGGFTIENRMRIMKDPHLGSFAVLGLVLLVLLQVQVINLIPVSQAIIIFGMAGALSRWSVLWPMFNVLYAKEIGLGRLFKQSPARYVIASIITLTVAITLVGTGAVVLVLGVFIFAWLLGLFAKLRFGGLTGDVCGFIIILTELFVIAVCPVVIRFLG